VCLAVWLACAGKDVTGKIVAMGCPIMAFASSFQHMEANRSIHRPGQRWMNAGGASVPL